jgi:hypothetical protein
MLMPKSINRVASAMKAAISLKPFLTGKRDRNLRNVVVVLKNGKCIIHSEKPDGPIDFVQQDAFDQALLDKVKTLGVPLVRAVDFTSYAPVFLNEFVDAVAKASGTRTAKFSECVFPPAVFWGGSSESISFYDRHYCPECGMLYKSSPNGASKGLQIRRCLRLYSIENIGSPQECPVNRRVVGSRLLMGQSR